MDILVNNGGVSYRGTMLDTDLDVHVKVMTVNYLGQVALTRGGYDTKMLYWLTQYDLKQFILKCFIKNAQI